MLASHQRTAAGNRVSEDEDRWMVLGLHTDHAFRHYASLYHAVSPSTSSFPSGCALLPARSRALPLQHSLRTLQSQRHTSLPSIQQDTGFPGWTGRGAFQHSPGVRAFIPSYPRPIGTKQQDTTRSAVVENAISADPLRCLVVSSLPLADPGGDANGPSALPLRSGWVDHHEILG